MDKQSKSIGIVEVKGMAALIICSDAAVKTANVEVIGYEKAKGNGAMALYISGDVSSVKAGITAAQNAILKLGQNAAAIVIARPDEEIYQIIPELEKQQIKKNELKEPGIQLSEISDMILQDHITSISKVEKSISKVEKNAVCNICGDPSCTRRKGEPRSRCIHYKKK